MDYEFGKICYVNRPGNRLHKMKAVMIGAIRVTDDDDDIHIITDTYEEKEVVCHEYLQAEPVRDLIKEVIVATWKKDGTLIYPECAGSEYQALSLFEGKKARITIEEII